MKRIFLSLFATGLIGILPSAASAGVNFVFDVMPGSILSSPDINGVKASRTTSGGWWTETVTEEITGTVNYAPTFKAGIGIDLPIMYIDLTAGGGWQLNGGFNGSILQGDAAARFKLGRLVTLGPHLGIMRFSPKWQPMVTCPAVYSRCSDSADISLGSTTGNVIGAAFTVGKKVSFSAQVDYLSGAKIDVETANGWALTKDGRAVDKINLSGVYIQLGMLCRFGGGD